MTHVNGRVGCMTWDLGQMSGSGKCGVRKVIFIGIVAEDNLSEWCWLLFCIAWASPLGRWQMERAEKDLETSFARWKRLFSRRQIDHGGWWWFHHLQFAKPWKSLEETFLLVVAPFQTCLCVEFAPFLCVDLSRGPISNMTNLYVDTTSRIMQLFFCPAHSFSPTEAKYL